MRKLLRNPGLRGELLAYGVTGALLSILGFVLDETAGAVAVCLTVCVLLVCALLARRRYDQMARLADLLDAILHGQSSWSLEDFSEGELSILQSELAKLLVALRRQSENLNSDKKTLADSLADISHQLKTPLTSLNLAAAMLSAPELTHERRLELTRDVTRQLARVEWLVSALLKMSRLDAGMAELSRERVTVAELVTAAASPLLIPLELRGVALIYDFQGDESFTGDPAWTAEALGNLLKNCMEHTPAGGSVTVSARENAIYTQLTVTDTGPGFDPEDLPHLFERFYRGKNAGPDSVGIGLALSRMILRSANATVKAENAPGGGARFTVRFYKGTV